MHTLFNQILKPHCLGWCTKIEEAHTKVPYNLKSEKAWKQTEAREQSLIKK